MIDLHKLKVLQLKKKELKISILINLSMTLVIIKPWTFNLNLSKHSTEYSLKEADKLIK